MPRARQRSPSGARLRRRTPVFASRGTISRQVIQPDRLADAPVLLAHQPPPSTLGSQHAIRVIADGDPSVRRLPWLQVVTRRQSDRVVVVYAFGVDRQPDHVNFLLAGDARESKHVLPPFDIAVDEITRGITSGENVE